MEHFDKVSQTQVQHTKRRSKPKINAFSAYSQRLLTHEMQFKIITITHFC